MFSFHLLKVKPNAITVLVDCTSILLKLFYIFLILLLTFSLLSVITKLTKNKREKNKGGTVHQKRNEIPNRI